MDNVKKDKTREYWSTNKLIETPIFGKIMSRNRFEKIWNFWQYSDSSTLDDVADRLYKIGLILDNVVVKFRKHYKPPPELSLEEVMVSWQGPLRFRTYNPGELVHYGILVCMVCEATTGYVRSMEIYTAEGKKLKETIFSVLEPYLDLWHHVYQDNYYNSVETVEKLFLKNRRVCRTVRANRGIRNSLADSSKKLKSNDAPCKVKMEVRMIRTIHNGTTGEVTNKFGERIKIANLCNSVQFHESCWQSRPVFIIVYHSKNHKMKQKFELWLINFILFNSFRVYKLQYPGSRLKYKSFLLEVAD
jgi:hypothetical protein